MERMPEALYHTDTQPLSTPVKVQYGDRYTFTLLLQEQSAATPVVTALTKPETRETVERTFGKGRLQEDETANLDIQVARLDYRENPKVGHLEVLSHGDTCIYLHEGQIVYSSEENRRSKFSTLAEFIASPKGNDVEILDGEAADVSFYGTINSNLPVQEGEKQVEDWMGLLEEKVQRAFPGIRVSNPNTKTNAQTEQQVSGLDMQQFARESQNLFDTPVIVMNFEKKRGGIALAELRMALLASVLTGHKLLIRIEKPEDNIDVQRSRAVAETDVRFFMKKFGSRLNIEFYGMDDAMSFEEFGEKVVQAIGENQGGTTRAPLPVPGNHQGERIVLSGSSASARDVAMRLELQRQMALAGKNMVDTYNPNFDGNPVSSDPQERIATIMASRRTELEQMYTATDHIVHAGESLSPFGQLTTALLFVALNGSYIRGLIFNPALFNSDADDIRDEYGGGTYRSHSAKIFMSPALANIMSLLSVLTKANGVAPEMQASIKVLSDAIQPIVDSFSVALPGNEKKR